jgi:hypothetical protein
MNWKCLALTHLRESAGIFVALLADLAIVA